MPGIPEMLEMPKWQVPATAALGASLALGIGCDSQPAPSRAELAAALGPCRPLEGRVVGLAYAPYSDHPASSLARRDAIARVRRRLEREAAQTGPGPSLARALLKITVRKWEAAASLLSAAGAAAKRDLAADRRDRRPPGAGIAAEIESDLAAVELAQAARDDDPRELASALAAATRAVRLQPELPEACFNLALAQERLFLVSHAATAWKRYLDLDHASPWAAEARRHLERLDTLAVDGWEASRLALDVAALHGNTAEVTRLVGRFRQQTRQYAERELLAEWARSAERGDDSRAANSLARFAAIARTLRNQTGDRLLDDVATLLHQANARRRQDLVAGHLAYAQALDFLVAERFEAAGRPLEVAQRRLTVAGSPWALWAAFQRALVAYREKRPDDALRSALGLVAPAMARSYFALAARSGWLAGLTLLERAEVSLATEALHPALAQFERLGEVANQASILSILASASEYLSMPREAWRLRLRALRAIVLAGDQERATVLFGSAAQAAAREGMPEVGLLFEDEVLARELGSGKPLVIAEAFWKRAMIQHQAGAEREAMADLAEASRYCAGIRTTGVRRHTEAVIAATQGAVERAGDPQAAVRTLTRSLRLFRSERFSVLKVEVLLDRALAFQSIGDLDRAEADLAAGIEEYERQRRQLHDATSRVSFFDRAEQIFDVMIRFQLERRHRPDRAFAYAERAKARTLLDAVGPGAKCPPADRECRPQETLDANSVMAALPPSMALIELHVMEERLLVWTLCGGRLSFVSVNTGAAKIAGLAAALAASAQGAATGPSFSRSAAELYELLIAPVAFNLPPAAGLVLVADKAIQQVPLAALFNRHTGRFLAQDHPLVVAASASTFTLGLLRARATGAARGHQALTALSVGDPELDLGRFPGLGPLPWAAQEADRTAGFYAGSVVLRGREATVARFLHEIDRHELVQFAGHAISYPDQRPRLLFAAAAAGADPGELDAGAIAVLRLHRPRLVILSACAAASGPAARLEGASSLARAFLAAGAPGVIANLWPVDDEVALAFTNRFHAAFAERQDELAALHSAQAGMLASSDARLRTPAAWAGFQLFGAAVTTGAVATSGSPAAPSTSRAPPA
jgi:CHAT domain-containing protein